MPPAARIGDIETVHCSAPLRAEGSPNVFVNGIPLSREGDPNTVHLLPTPPGCSPHQAAIISGSSSVNVNGKPAGRVGDPTCTAVAAGSPNVMIGG